MLTINRHKNNQQQGISLLSMAITLAIIGVVGVGALLSYSEQDTASRWQQSNAKLLVVKQALLKFANENSYMPCPTVAAQNGAAFRQAVTGVVDVNPIGEQPAQPETAFSPYVPAIPAVNPQVQITNVPVNRCRIDEGEVPYALIGLSAADVEDAWGNRFIYAVDKGVTSANAMLDCLTDADAAQTACFFNNTPLPNELSQTNPDINNQYSALPWYGKRTQPLFGGVSASNLNICNDPSCVDFNSIGQIAMLIALNENGLNNIAAGTAEAENTDGDNNFVAQTYTQAPFYDDLILSISAHDLDIKSSVTPVENSVARSGNPRISGDSSAGLGKEKSSEALGTNISTADIREEDISIDSQVISFGQEHAGKKVIMTLDTFAFGSWDQPSHWGTRKKRKGETTSDSAMIKVNDANKTLRYKHNGNPPRGDQVFDNDYQKVRSYRFYDPALDSDGVYTEGETNSTRTGWTDSHELVFELDQDGNANIDFVVATTGQDERVVFNNVELVLYDTPPLVPDFPLVVMQNGNQEIRLGGEVDQTNGSNTVSLPGPISPDIRGG